jgi:hypothetical protein
LLTWSRSLQGQGSRSARPIIRIWGILVLIGAACTFALLQSSQRTANAIDTSSALDCSALAATAETQKLKLRDPNHVLSALYDRIFGTLYSLLATHLAPLTFIPLFFGALSCAITITQPVLYKQSPDYPQTQHWNGIEVSISDNTSTSPVTTLRTLFLTLRRVILYLTPCWLIPVLVVNELYLLKDWSGPMGIPEVEKMYEVGQWGLLTSLGLVSAAAGVNWLAGRGKEPAQVVRAGGGTGGKEVWVA